MTNESTQKRRGCWRFALYALLFFGLLSLAGGIYLLWPTPAKPLHAFLPIATGGMAVLELDPNDPELIAFIEALSDGEVDLDRLGGNLGRGLLRGALHPLIVVVFDYDATAAGSNLRRYFGESESVAGTVQFRRFAHIIYKVAKNRLLDQHRPEEIRVAPNAVWIEPEGEAPVTALTGGAFLVSSSEKLAQSVIGALNAETPEDTKTAESGELERRLFERLRDSMGQIRLYQLNPDDRFAYFFEALKELGALDPQIRSILSPDVIAALNESILGLYAEGELLSAEIAEFSISIVCSDVGTASLVGDMLEERIVPELERQFPKQEFSVERNGDEVSLRLRLIGLIGALQADR